MSGKKSSINSKFRELLAKIQRDFHFPRVYAIRCAVSTQVHAFHQDIPVNIKTPKPLSTTCQNLQLEMPVNLRAGSFEDPECLTMQPLEEAATDTRAVECYDICEFKTNQIATEVFIPDIHTPKDMQILAKTVQIQTELPIPLLKGKVGSFKMSVRTNTRRAHEEGISFPLTLMKDLSMRQIIRYRTVGLRRIGMRANQIEFIGVCLKVPPVPLRFDAIKSSDNQHVAIGVVRGIPDPYLGKQSWIIYRLKSNGNVQSLLIRAEE